jgi:hypothetical protein
MGLNAKMVGSTGAGRQALRGTPAVVNPGAKIGRGAAATNAPAGAKRGGKLPTKLTAAGNATVNPVPTGSTTPLGKAGTVADARAVRKSQKGY